MDEKHIMVGDWQDLVGQYTVVTDELSLVVSQEDVTGGRIDEI